MRFFGRKKQEPQKQISIRPELASTAVMLANPDSDLYELSQKLLELRERGYQIHPQFRSRLEGVYSESLNRFLGRLENGGYTRRGEFRNYRDLTDHGVNLLETELLEAFSKNPRDIRNLAQDTGVDLDSIISSFLDRIFKKESFPQSSSSS